MKELHNHIFSNTTCISKEIMLRYINKQLSKKELYEVEKHMLDCELCTDAFEGMKMATNSSMLFAIDNKIDLRTGGGVKKSPIMRNLMVAASVMLIAFGAYFTVNNFNKSVDKESLAVNKPDQLNVPENFINQNRLKEKGLKSIASEVIIDAALENNKQESLKVTTIEADKITMVNDEVETPKDVVALNAEEDVVEEFEAEELAGLPKEELAANERNDNELVNNSVEENVAVASSLNSSFREAKTRSKYKKKDSNKPARKYEVSVAENKPEMEESVINERQNTYDIYSYKVYDYAVEYQNEYDFKKAAEVQTVAPGFSNQKDKGLAEKEVKESMVEITYKATLEKGVHYLKEEQYQLAINQFNLILKAHPKDINALFYGGIALYNINQFEAAKIKFKNVLTNKQTTFNQEAKWYQAKSLMALKDTKNAKIILQEIIDANGFYKEQAKAKIVELK